MLLSVPLTMAIKIALESNPKTMRYAALLGDISEETLEEVINKETWKTSGKDNQENS